MGDRASVLAGPDLDALIDAAREVRARAYAPYSQYRVGAAIRGADGATYLGVNVENSAYPTCQCAERVAIGNAVTAGCRRVEAKAQRLRKAVCGPLCQRVVAPLVQLVGGHAAALASASSTTFDRSSVISRCSSLPQASNASLRSVISSPVW
jgi:homotetrameric cytidine deaminase